MEGSPHSVETEWRETSRSWPKTPLDRPFAKFREWPGACLRHVEGPGPLGGLPTERERWRLPTVRLERSATSSHAQRIP